MKFKNYLCLVLAFLMVVSMVATLGISVWGEEYYTVDFSYNGKTKSVFGNSKNVNFDCVLCALDINDHINQIEIFNCDKTISFGNEAKNAQEDVLFDIVKKNDTWELNSYVSFTDVFVVIASSEEKNYEIIVTDPRTDTIEIELGQTFECTSYLSGKNISSDEVDGNYWFFSTSDDTILQLMDFSFDNQKLTVQLKGLKLGQGLYVTCKRYDEEANEWVDDVISNGLFNVVPATLDLDSADNKYPDNKTIDQNYTLSTSPEYTDMTKVKLEWTMQDISATRKDAKKWDPEQLMWVDDNDNDVITAEPVTAVFTITNLSSVKVDAKVEFSAVSGFNPEIEYTGVDATSHKTTINTVVKVDKTVDTEIPHDATVNVKVSPNNTDFANASATTSATKYGSYIVTITKSAESRTLFIEQSGGGWAVSSVTVNGTAVNVTKTRDSDGYITVTEGDEVVVNFSQARDYYLYTYTTQTPNGNETSNVTISSTSFNPVLSVPFTVPELDGVVGVMFSISPLAN